MSEIVKSYRGYSVDDFWDIYTEDENFESYYKGDLRIENHAGLSFLNSLHFKYPTVDIFDFKNKSSNGKKDWNAESILKSEFGYSTLKGISEHSRRNALRNAAKSPNKISLKEIAERRYFIFNFVCS